MTSWKDRNQQHFDATATKYDGVQFANEMTIKSAKAILDAYKAANPDHQDAHVLEFGIGSGMVAFQVAPFVQSIVGVDISEGMLKQVHEKQKDPQYAAVASKITTIHHHVRQDDPLPSAFWSMLASSSSSATAATAATGTTGRGAGFDMVYANAVMHHVENAADTIQTLVHHFLKPGTGRFYMIDIRNEDGLKEKWQKLATEVFDAGVAHDQQAHGHHHHHHHHHHDENDEAYHHHQHHGHGHGHGLENAKAHKIADIVPHDMGFKEADLHQWLTRAGLVDVQVQTCFTFEFDVPSMNSKVPLSFVMASGRRP